MHVPKSTSLLGNDRCGSFGKNRFSLVSGHQIPPPLNVKCCARRAKMLWKTPFKVSVIMFKQLAKLISIWMRSSVKRSNQNRNILLLIDILYPTFSLSLVVIVVVFFFSSSFFVLWSPFQTRDIKQKRDETLQSLCFQSSLSLSDRTCSISSLLSSNLTSCNKPHLNISLFLSLCLSLFCLYCEWFELKVHQRPLGKTTILNRDSPSLC